MNLPDYIKEFREKNEDIAEAILGALEYRGFNDCGKYLNNDLLRAIEPFITKLVEEAEVRGRNQAVDYVLTNADIGILSAKELIFFLDICESARTIKP